MTGAAGIARLMDEKDLLKTVERLWESTTVRKMYVTVSSQSCGMAWELWRY